MKHLSPCPGEGTGWLKPRFANKGSASAFRNLAHRTGHAVLPLPLVDRLAQRLQRLFDGIVLSKGVRRTRDDNAPRLRRRNRAGHAPTDDYNQEDAWAHLSGPSFRQEPNSDATSVTLIGT